jgi:hypothetical protein
MDLSVKLVRITGGHFSVGSTGAHTKPLVLEEVNLEVRDFSAAAAFPFTFDTKVAGGGAIKLDGQAGPIDSVDVAATWAGEPQVDKLTSRALGSRARRPSPA